MTRNPPTDSLVKAIAGMTEQLRKKREELREERPVDLEFKSCDELDYFYVKLPDDPDFHCEITLHQQTDNGATFRHVAAQILDDEIVNWATEGVPEEHHDRLKARVMVIYRLIYPEGLTLEGMRE